MTAVLNPFKLNSTYRPTGDQPTAISTLINGLENGEKEQTLLGVTGSGKTFTMANVIEKINKPTLILAPNKTLAAQLYSEFKMFCLCNPGAKLQQYLERVGAKAITCL